MHIHFNIHYATHFGQVLLLSGSAKEAGNFQEDKAPEMIYTGNGNWSLTIDLNEAGTFEYRYLVKENGKIQRKEWGKPHSVTLWKSIATYFLNDSWQAETSKPYLYTSAFTDSFLAVEEQDTTHLYKPGHIVLKVFAPYVRRGQSLAISGDTDFLGNWDSQRAIAMLPGKFPEWSISFKASELPENSKYKFVIKDQQSEKNSYWEYGEPRYLNRPRITSKAMMMVSGMIFKYQGPQWKGAGVSIPVFSLRSEKSWGCGDFSDLKKMVEWAEKTGQQLVQLLPVNDTSITGTWLDSYPYNAVSIFALHPAYLSIDQLPPLKDENKMAELEINRKKLNDLPEIDYEKVLALKTEYTRELYFQEGKTILRSKGFKAFFEKNKDWLVPYAAFRYLRVKFNDFNFRNWGDYAIYDVQKIADLCQSSPKGKDEIAISYYTQYLLHIQLTDARDFAHTHSVVLKGDIPIGISPFSVEAWTEPHLFNLDSQIGAPPDDFSEKGQNWGFPAYNWEQMAAGNYQWWIRRFRKMADYFDAYRIDHILGFFRIWEIPNNSVEGLLGHFQPALPFSQEEIRNYGFFFNESMTEPFITNHVIETLFHDKAGEVREKYLKKGHEERYQLKTEYNTQLKIRNHFGDHPSDADLFIKNGLFELCNDVLFVKDSHQPKLLHPRISGQKTFWYQALDYHQKNSYNSLHDDFFYKRNVDFWRQKALEKLPHILNATRMLVCGEDLGMIPECVPDVMHRLNILSLEIQRMPKTLGIKFENLNYLPYMSVCTTSTHDMNPVRAWWNEDRGNTQQYFQEILWKHGEAPQDCTPEIARTIVQNHLNAPSMWVILPWQDWMSIDGRLRRKKAEEERINVPSNPRHYWRYRMHMTLEKLLNEEALNNAILLLNKSAGRY